jgi:hypothetical protein
MISTRIAYAILKKLAEKTVGSRLLFDGEGREDKHSIKIDGIEYDSVGFCELWSDENQLKSTLKQAFEWAYAGGDSILKADSDGRDMTITPMRKDSYLIDTDFRGRICKFMGFIYSYTKTIPQQGSESSRRMYYIVEEREYINGVPMFRVGIKTSDSQMTNGKPTDNIITDTPFDRLPKDIVRKFKKDFPDVIIGQWKRMPFKDLGIYQIKATRNVSFLPDAPFGESILSPLIHILMTYDFYFSSLTTNLYTSRDKVILPQNMETPNLSGADDFYANRQNWYSGLDNYLYTRVPYTDPENQKPIFIQPEIRDWKKVREILLQSAAMNIGVDERTISQSIVPNAEKPTAREISVDEDTTTSFVEEKRDLNDKSINDLIRAVLYFYGFTEEIVKVKFSKAGLSNINNLVTIATLLKQNQLGDRKSLLELVWPDKNDIQIENMMNKMDEEFEKAMEMQNNSPPNVEEGIEQQNNNTEYHVPKKGEE